MQNKTHFAEQNFFKRFEHVYTHSHVFSQKMFYIEFFQKTPHGVVFYGD